MANQAARIVYHMPIPGMGIDNTKYLMKNNEPNAGSQRGGFS
jgi:hypothetical protein